MKSTFCYYVIPPYLEAHPMSSTEFHGKKTNVTIIDIFLVISCAKELFGRSILY